MANEVVENSSKNDTEPDKSADIVLFKRYLMTGAEGPSFTPASCTDLSPPFSIKSLSRLLEIEEGVVAVNAVVESSNSGLSVKRDYMICALALLARYQPDAKVRRAAYKALPLVCKTSSDLFLFVSYAKTLSGTTSGWGRAQRTAIAQWYNSRSAMDLAKEVTTSRARNGWNHRDILKLAHITPANEGVAMMFRYILKGTEGAMEKLSKMKGEFKDGLKPVLRYLVAVHAIKCSRDAHQVESLVTQHKLSLQHVPTWHSKSKEVWRGLLHHISITELLPHLGRLAGAGFFDEATPDNLAALFVEKFKDKEAVSQSGVLPMQMYLAMRTYELGRTERSKHRWTANKALTEAMCDAFHTSFENIVPTKKRYLLAIDMHTGLKHGEVAGLYNAKPLPAVGVLAMCLARSEPVPVQLVTFGKTVATVRITHKMGLSEVLHTLQDSTRKSNSPSTECASPILWAKETKKAFDMFIVMTDCDKWSGLVNPLNALADYQKDMDIPNAKLVLCSVPGKEISLATESQLNTMDVIGLGENIYSYLQAYALNLL